MNRAVFVATLGAAPQVVTLTLDALLAQGVLIERVIVVHTLPDRAPVQQSLARLEREFFRAHQYPERLAFVSHLLAGENGPLSDVVTPADLKDISQKTTVFFLYSTLKDRGGMKMQNSGRAQTKSIFRKHAIFAFLPVPW